MNSFLRQRAILHHIFHNHTISLIYCQHNDSDEYLVNAFFIFPLLFKTFNMCLSIECTAMLSICFQVLRAGGATHVSCYVTHAVFPNESWRRFTDPDLNLETFWITDSIPHSHEISKHAPFQLLSLADVIVDALWGYDLTQ